MTRHQAVAYSHEDLSESREYRMPDLAGLGRAFFGHEIKTACGHWFSACEDDPKYNPNVWRFARDDHRVTCPECLAWLAASDAADVLGGTAP